MTKSRPGINYKFSLLGTSGKCRDIFFIFEQYLSIVTSERVQIWFGCVKLHSRKIVTCVTSLCGDIKGSYIYDHKKWPIFKPPLTPQIQKKEQQIYCLKIVEFAKMWQILTPVTLPHHTPLSCGCHNFMIA